VSSSSLGETSRHDFLIQLLPQRAPLLLLQPSSRFNPSFIYRSLACDTHSHTKLRHARTRFVIWCASSAVEARVTCTDSGEASRMLSHATFHETQPPD
jgi:hypothetical protein